VRFACGSTGKTDHVCVGFSARSTEKTTQGKIKYRSAEGSTHQLRKS
jgi:hypothetical protein